MGGIVSGQRPIYTCTFNTNYCFPIVRWRVDGLLWPISNFIIISSMIKRVKVSDYTWPTSMTYTITWVRVAGILRHMSTTFKIAWLKMTGIKRPMSPTFLTQRHWNKFSFITFIAINKTEKRRIARLTRQIS